MLTKNILDWDPQKVYTFLGKQLEVRQHELSHFKWHNISMRQMNVIYHVMKCFINIHFKFSYPCFCLKQLGWTAQFFILHIIMLHNFNMTLSIFFKFIFSLAVSPIFMDNFMLFTYIFHTYKKVKLLHSKNIIYIIFHPINYSKFLIIF